MFAVLPSYAQTQRPGHVKPPPFPPESCALPLIQLHDVTGSNAYIRLRYVIEALSSAQEAVSGMALSMKESDAATDTANALAPLITGTNGAKDALHCAAAIMDQYRAIDEDDRITKVVGVASN